MNRHLPIVLPLPAFDLQAPAGIVAVQPVEETRPCPKLGPSFYEKELSKVSGNFSYRGFSVFMYSTAFFN